MGELESYSQPVKNEARRLVLTQAVKVLTTGRNFASIVVPHEFQETLNYTIGFLGSYESANLFSELGPLVDEWRKFQKGVNGSKRPSDLHVLYLCGPEPNNDLDVLLEIGILRQNIWAVEEGDRSYCAAVDQLKATSNFIRIHHGSLKSFFSNNNERFDIIYIDACGAFPEPKEIQCILELFRRERLASPGALITNFALPGEEKRTDYENLMACYFAPRFLDTPTALVASGFDYTVGNPSELLEAIRQNFAETYSDFVTRYIIDLGREVVPHERIQMSNDVKRNYFSESAIVKSEVENALAADSKPLEPDGDFYIWLRSFVKGKKGIVLLDHKSFPVLNFLHEIQHSSALQRYRPPEIDVNSWKRVSLLCQTGGHRFEQLASQQLQLAVASGWFDMDRRLYCDTPEDHLIINSLIGIYGRPYLPNPRKSFRYSYVAKATQMYLDLLIFDQCRYYFDFLPTIDLIPKRFESEAYQLILRVCLDRICWHDFNSSSKPFRGAALGGFGTTRCAKAYDLCSRKALARQP